jgi:hypothetical protein
VGDDYANGSGYVDHDKRGSFTDLSLSGNVGNARFRLDFDASGGGTGQPGGSIDSISTVERGHGTLEFRTRSSTTKLSTITVRLNRDHRFEIKPSGGETFKGRWWQENDRVVRLDTDRVDWTSATGSGSLRLDGRNSVDEVRLEGSVSNARYKMVFQAGSPSISDGDNDEHTSWDYRQAARRAVQQRFPNAALTWSDERVGQALFGKRTVSGSVRVLNTNKAGRYNYRVSMVTTSMLIKSVDIDRD